MHPLSLVHVSGPLAGDRVELPRLPATIGSGPDADVVVPGTAARHAVLFAREGHVILLDSGSEDGTFLDGERVHEVVLKPGDVVHLGPEGPRLRFEQDVAAAPAVVAPSPMSQTLAMRVMAHSSRSARRTLALVVVLGALVLGWSWQSNRRVSAELNTLRQAMGRVEKERRDLEKRVEQVRAAADDQRALLERRLEDYRDREEELRTKLADAASGEVQTLKGELDTTRQRIATLETERLAGEQIIRQYGGGVALIQGAYAFYDADRRPLRYRSDSEQDQEGDADTLSADGEGSIHVVEYYGTGFLVKDGLILTNRHVAQPWWNDAAAAELQRQGYEPRFQYLRAFFPRHKEPYELKLDRASETVDLALVRTSRTTANIPVLPLDREPRRTQPGQPVVVVGYPTGLEAILAKAESSVVKEILESHGADSSRVTVALARQDLIRPSTTQGHIGDITGSDIVFDAPSAQGGSGGPVFNKHGQVIAVEYAVLQKFGGNAFGIPIAFAHELIRTARRDGD